MFRNPLIELIIRHFAFAVFHSLEGALGPARNQREGVLEGHENQEVGATGVF